MSVELDPPNQLSFRRPLTVLVKEILRVRNTNPEPVAFKVKTTAPKQYCVRPNSGRIEPNSEVEVQVLLNPMKEDPSLDYKCKDKFLVQSVTIKPEWGDMQVNDIWNAAEESAKDSFKEKKVKCVYLPPVGYESGDSTPKDPSSPAHLHVPGGAISGGPQSPQLSNRTSMNGLNETFHATSDQPRQSTSTSAHEKRLGEGSSGRQSQQQSVPIPAKSTSSSSRPNSTALSPTSAVENSTTSGTPNASGANVAKLENDLIAAHQTIKRLEATLEQYKKDLARAQEDQSELRRRISSPATGDRVVNNRRISNAEKAAATISPHDAVHQVINSMKYPPPVEGYPPIVVGVVALLVFIFTWLFL